MAPFLLNVVRDDRAGNPEPENPPAKGTDGNLTPAAMAGIILPALIGIFGMVTLISWIVMSKWQKRGRFSIRLNDLVLGRETPTRDYGSPVPSPSGWRNGRHPADASPINRRTPTTEPTTDNTNGNAASSRRRSYRQTSIINVHTGQSHNTALITVPEHDDDWNLSPSNGPIMNYVSFSAFHNPLESRTPWGPPPPYQCGHPAIPSARVANHTQSTSHHGAYHADISNTNESIEDDEVQPLFANRRAPAGRRAVGVANSGIRPSN